MSPEQGEFDQPRQVRHFEHLFELFPEAQTPRFDELADLRGYSARIETTASGRFEFSIPDLKFDQAQTTATLGELSGSSLRAEHGPQIAEQMHRLLNPRSILSQKVEAELGIRADKNWESELRFMIDVLGGSERPRTETEPMRLASDRDFEEDGLDGISSLNVSELQDLFSPNTDGWLPSLREIVEPIMQMKAKESGANITNPLTIWKRFEALGKFKRGQVIREAVDFIDEYQKEELLDRYKRRHYKPVRIILDDNVINLNARADQLGEEDEKSPLLQARKAIDTDHLPESDEPGEYYIVLKHRFGVDFAATPFLGTSSDRNEMELGYEYENELADQTFRYIKRSPLAGLLAIASLMGERQISKREEEFDAITQAALAPLKIIPRSKELAAKVLPITDSHQD